MNPRTTLATATVLATALLLAGAWGCGTPCETIRKERAAFDAPPTVLSPEPHLTLRVPFGVVDRLLAAQVYKLGSIPLELPGLAGPGVTIPLEGWTLAVDRLRLRRDEPGRVGFALRLVVRDGRASGDPAAWIDMDVSVRPQVELKGGSVVVPLKPADVTRVRPELSARSRQQLEDALLARVPQQAKAFVPRGAVGKLADMLAGWLVENLHRLIRRELLVGLGEVARLEFDLPKLPLRRLSMTSEEHALRLEVWTLLPVHHGAPGLGLSRAGGPAVRVAGGLLAALYNAAADGPELPRRFDGAMKPRADGPYEVTLGWRPGPRPLAIHAWELDDERCLHAVIRGTPQIALTDDAVRVRVDDGVMAKVEGPALIELGAWLESLTADAVRISLDLARSTELSVGGQRYRVAIRAAAAAEYGVDANLAVEPVPE